MSTRYQTVVRLLPLMIASVFLIGITTSQALTPSQATPLQPPAIILFESDLPTITVDAAQSAETTATLSWHVIHFLGIHRLTLETFSYGQWISVLEPQDTIAPVDSREVVVNHPGSFGPPTFRLTLSDTRGTLIDQRTLTISYESDGEPQIQEFLVSLETIDASTLQSGRARIIVSWEITDRLPTSNLVFDQLNPDGSAVSIELDRDRLWVASSGDGLTAPIMPDEGYTLRLRLRVMDVVTAEVYDEMIREVAITGALPTREPSPTPADQDASG